MLWTGNSTKPTKNPWSFVQETKHQYPQDRLKGTRIAGALWLQGESDSNSPEHIAAYPAGIKQMIEDLRADLGIPKLPFIACTIGELKAGQEESRGAINAILLDLPNQVPYTACADSRKFPPRISVTRSTSIPRPKSGTANCML